MDGRALDELQALERRDEELAARSAELRSLDDAVGQIRGRAEAIEAFFAAYPASEARRRAQVADAERELAERREEQAAAETAVAEARGEEERELREKALARVRDHVTVAESRLERALADHEQLEAEASELPSELTALEAEARALAGLSGPPGADGLAEWASRSHAELFVMLSQLAAERERVIREANELASSVLGEPTFGSTVAQARRQVEARA